MRSNRTILRQIIPRLLVLTFGLVVLILSAFCWLHWGYVLYGARWTMLWIVGFSSIGFGLWLLSLGRLKATSILSRFIPRVLALTIGLVVLNLSGLFLLDYGLLWSPLPWEPREYDYARQKLFWLLAPPTIGLGLWLIDLVRVKALRLTDKRLMIPILVLIVLVVIALVTDNYLYARLDHGQGG